MKRQFMSLLKERLTNRVHEQVGNIFSWLLHLLKRNGWKKRKRLLWQQMKKRYSDANNLEILAGLLL